MQENWDHIHKTFGSGFLLTRFISATVSPVCFCSLAIFLKHLHAVVYYCRTTFFLFFVLVTWYYITTLTETLNICWTTFFKSSICCLFCLVMKSQEWKANLWVTTPLHIIFDLLAQSLFSSVLVLWEGNRSWRVLC